MEDPIFKQGIASFFKDRSVFITGGTGFLGKVLVWKLLNSCPEIKNIFLLIRSKRSLDPKERLRSLFKDCPIFEFVEEEALGKVKAVVGDINEEGLGLEKEDEEMLAKSVSVVFHSAATVRFDDPLTETLTMNVGGTKSMLDLAKKMSSLKSFIHVSTAFSHCYMQSIEEQIYENIPTLSPDLMKQFLEERPEDLQNRIKTILGEWPNTYCYSKAMAEELIREIKGDLPVAIVRPSIVVAARKEPFPGWVDNYNGPTGIIASTCAGILRSMYVDASKTADMIPVDTVINLMIAVAFKTAKEDNKDLPVYHCISGSSNPITWGRMRKWGYEGVIKYPFQKVLWFPKMTITTSKTADVTKRFFYQWIPAYLVDFLAVIFCQKPFLVRINKRLSSSMDALAYFANREWSWNDGQTTSLYANLNEKDQMEFDFDITRMDWRSFMQNYILGVRDMWRRVGMRVWRLLGGGKWGSMSWMWW